MKYIMLTYTDKAGWEALNESWDPSQGMPEEMQAACDFYEQLGKELIESGEFVATEGLADPSHTRTLRKQDGVAVATDGPYAEAKEVLVSFAIVDCESHDRALEIAARVVEATGDTVEVRPIMDGAGAPEM
ncbi:MAG TPA: YciI family protein [Cryptosporangiaceae bacterium]|nr:YciI family protein [Cryptosporangiaceae bacterium]